MSAGAKGAVRWSAHAILMRSGVAGASRLMNSLPRPAASRALYTASCIAYQQSLSGLACPAEAIQGMELHADLLRSNMLPWSVMQLSCSAL